MIDSGEARARLEVPAMLCAQAVDIAAAQRRLAAPAEDLRHLAKEPLDG
jgi:hypothetical protein